MRNFFFITTSSFLLLPSAFFTRIISVFLVLTSAFFLLPSAFSQSSLYMPLDIKRAYDNGTRSYDGSPGPRYWQNSSEYNIKVSIDPASRLLSGSGTIIYHNNSPDTLEELVLRMYQDIHKSISPRDFNLSPDAVTDGITLNSISVGGVPLDRSNSAVVRRQGTNLYLTPPAVVLPHSEVRLEVEWEFTIPKRGIRMGAYDSTSFMIAYWYPQMSVYDDIDGWDETDYTGLLEFYNDFSNYIVEISVPAGFCVWSTGVLQNPEEVYSPEILARYNFALLSDSVIHIITADDLRGAERRGSPMNKTNRLTYHVRAGYVPDFAFALSNHYLWDASSYSSPPGSPSTPGRVLISAAYDPASLDFYEVCSVARSSVEFFSEEFPAVPFPYPRLTVFNGSGGMEFPMMVNDGSSDSRAGMVFVTTHEIAHTYFPFYMGINERKYAWMDEGWATMLPLDLQNRLAPERDSRARIVFRYMNTAGTFRDVPLMTSSDNLGSSGTYGMASYFKPGTAYDILRDMLGKETFDKALREFMHRWHGKHPTPYDFFFTFNSPFVKGEQKGVVSVQVLSWFFKPWFFETGYPDLGIKQVKITGGKVKVIVEKLGTLPVPVYLMLETADGDSLIVRRTAIVWKEGVREVTIQIETGKTIKAVNLGSPHIPDAVPENNIYFIR
jgi:hypothetical protein